MADEPRIFDHDELIAAARADAEREGARYVCMTVGELWRLVHGVPRLTPAERERLQAALQPR